MPSTDQPHSSITQDQSSPADNDPRPDRIRFESRDRNLSSPFIPSREGALHVIHYGENRAKAVGGHTLHEDKVDLAAIALGEFDRIFPSILRVRPSHPPSPTKEAERNQCEPVLDAAIHQLVPPFEITPSVIIADIVLSVSPEQAINPIIRRHLSQAQIGPVKILRSAPISAATFAW